MYCTYEERHTQLKHSTKIGLIIGFIIGAIGGVFGVIDWIEHGAVKWDDVFEVGGGIVLIAITICLSVAPIIYVKSGTKDLIAELTGGIVHGAVGVIFELGAGGTIGLGLAAFVIVVCIMMLIPTMLYMWTSYAIDSIFVVIMAHLEKRGRLDGKGTLCGVLDKVVFGLSIGAALLICGLLICNEIA